MSCTSWPASALVSYEPLINDRGAWTVGLGSFFVTDRPPVLFPPQKSRSKTKNLDMNLKTMERLIALNNNPSMIIFILPILNQASLFLLVGNLIQLDDHWKLRAYGCLHTTLSRTLFPARQESRRESWLTLSRALRCDERLLDQTGYSDSCSPNSCDSSLHIKQDPWQVPGPVHASSSYCKGISPRRRWSSWSKTRGEGSWANHSHTDRNILQDLHLTLASDWRDPRFSPAPNVDD